MFKSLINFAVKPIPSGRDDVVCKEQNLDFKKLSHIIGTAFGLKRLFIFLQPGLKGRVNGLQRKLLSFLYLTRNDDKSKGREMRFEGVGPFFEAQFLLFFPHFRYLSHLMKPNFPFHTTPTS